MGDAFDDAVRAAARRVADGGDAEAEARELEAAIETDPEAYLRPAADVESLPSVQYIAYGHVDGRLVRGSLVLSEALFAPDRFLGITAASLAVTVRYLLDGTITARGAHAQRDVVDDVDAFAADYTELIPQWPAGTPLFERRFDTV